MLSPIQVAELFGVHPQTIYRNNSLPRVLVGRQVRYRAADIEKYLTSHTLPPCPPSSKHDIIMLGGGENMPKGKRKGYYSFGYGAILVRRRKDGLPRYYLDYKEDGRRKREVVSEAASIEDAIVALKDRLTMSDTHRISFSTWAERYLESHIKPHLKKPRSEELRLGNLKAWFKVDDLRKITPTTIDEFRAWRLRESNSRPTVNRYIALLKTMLNRAVDEGYLEQNPCRKIKQYSERDREHMRVLTEDEEIRLYAELADHIKPIVTIALNTGLRLGEIMKLKWSDIDLSKQLLKIENTKSGKVRYVPISNVLVRILSEIRQVNKTNSPRLFNIENPKRGFQGAICRAKILGLRFHDLRHTAATRLLGRGADIETVRQILGHSSLSVTQKYVHSGLDQQRQAVESLPIVSHICPMQKSNILNMPSKLVN